VNSYYLIFLAAGFVTVILIAAIILHGRCGNTRIYAMIDGEYRFVQIQRVSARAPELDLASDTIGGKSDEFMLAFDKKAVKSMRGTPVKIIGKDGATQEQSIANARHFRIYPQKSKEDYTTGDASE
jgi:hypothetical protein